MTRFHLLDRTTQALTRVFGARGDRPVDTPVGPVGRQAGNAGDLRSRRTVTGNPAPRRSSARVAIGPSLLDMTDTSAPPVPPAPQAPPAPPVPAVRPAVARHSSIQPAVTLAETAPIDPPRPTGPRLSLSPIHIVADIEPVLSPDAPPPFDLGAATRALPAEIRHMVGRYLLLGQELDSRGPEGQVRYLFNPRRNYDDPDLQQVTNDVRSIFRLDLVHEDDYPNIHQIAVGLNSVHRVGNFRGKGALSYSFFQALAEVDKINGSENVVKEGETIIFQFSRNAVLNHWRNVAPGLSGGLDLKRPLSLRSDFSLHGPQTGRSLLLHAELHQLRHEFNSDDDYTDKIEEIRRVSETSSPREQAGVIGHLSKFPKWGSNEPGGISSWLAGEMHSLHATPEMSLELMDEYSKYIESEDDVRALFGMCADIKHMLPSLLDGPSGERASVTLGKLCRAFVATRDSYVSWVTGLKVIATLDLFREAYELAPPPVVSPKAEWRERAHPLTHALHYFAQDTDGYRLLLDSVLVEVARQESVDDKAVSLMTLLPAISIIIPDDEKTATYLASLLFHVERLDMSNDIRDRLAVMFDASLELRDGAIADRHIDDAQFADALIAIRSALEVEAPEGPVDTSGTPAT